MTAGGRSVASLWIEVQGWVGKQSYRLAQNSQAEVAVGFRSRYSALLWLVCHISDITRINRGTFSRSLVLTITHVSAESTRRLSMGRTE